VTVLDDPRCLDLPPRSVGGKVVDAPVPPLEVVLDVFTAAGLPAPPLVQLPWGPDQWTVSGNCNGGLYLVPDPLLPEVARAWDHWARWLLDRVELLGEWTVHVDQVAMALALAAEGVTPFPLDVRWNTPIHDPTRIPADPPEPAVIHYHQEVDARGLIRTTGRTSIDRRIDIVNRAIQEVWTRATPTATFLEWLARSDAEELEGEDRRRILGALVHALEPATVLEVGGASEVGRSLSRSGGYTAIDEPPIAGHASERRPEADLVLCFDPLVRPLDGEEHRDLVRRLWQSTRRALVVRGVEGPDDVAGRSTDAHEPLSAVVRQVAPDAEIYPVKAHGPMATFVVLRPLDDKHPRDVTPATLDPLVARHPDPLSLITLRLHALRTTRFYPDHAPRVWEYPVVAKIITEQLSPGSRVIDVGAGVTPLAPFLNSRGYVVDTVDPSPNVRTWPPQPDWNEWDYLDYGTAGLAHRSWHCTLHEVPSRPLFDGVYSVSVIEHLPGSVRRALLADISARTRLGGLVVLTIDLVRGTEDLWNLNLGVVVEELVQHGTLQDVVGECSALGLELFRHEVVRDWGDSRVDIGLLALRQSAVPSPGGWRTASRRLISRVRRSSV
jgi:2-polyprenyl-3-methyl-5-hydroxy-6-metoxy-1,4-benzoquinol methylase